MIQANFQLLSLEYSDSILVVRFLTWTQSARTISASIILHSSAATADLPTEVAPASTITCFPSRRLGGKGIAFSRFIAQRLFNCRKRLPRLLTTKESAKRKLQSIHIVMSWIGLYFTIIRRFKGIWTRNHLQTNRKRFVVTIVIKVKWQLRSSLLNHPFRCVNLYSLSLFLSLAGNFKGHQSCSSFNFRIKRQFRNIGENGKIYSPP